MAEPRNIRGIVRERTKSMADINDQFNRILSREMDRTRRERVLDISSTYHNNIADALGVSSPFGDNLSYRRQIPQSVYRRNNRR